MKNTLLSILGRTFSNTGEEENLSSIGGAGTGLGKRKAEQNFKRADSSIQKGNSVFRCRHFGKRKGIRSRSRPGQKNMLLSFFCLRIGNEEAPDASKPVEPCRGWGNSRKVFSFRPGTTRTKREHGLPYILTLFPLFPLKKS